MFHLHGEAAQCSPLPPLLQIVLLYVYKVKTIVVIIIKVVVGNFKIQTASLAPEKYPRYDVIQIFINFSMLLLLVSYKNLQGCIR